MGSKKYASYDLKKDHLKRLSIVDEKIDSGSACDEDKIRRDSITLLGDLDRLENKDLVQKAK